MNRILIIQTRPGIGDLCIFLSSVHEISKNNPNSDITLVTKKRTRAKEILKHDSYINRIVFLDDDIYKNKKKFFTNLNYLKNFILKNNFSKVYIMHYGIRYLLLCKFVGIKKIFSYPFLKKKDNISKKIYEQTLKWLNINSFNRNASINLDKDNNNEDKSNNIIIGVGSSGETRKWKTQKFIHVINYLNNKQKYKFLITGGKNEETIATEIISGLSKDIDITSMCAQPIYKILKKIEGSLFYFGTDSAFMHLSAGLKVKSFPLFGDTPINYSEYSDYIFPILPTGFKSVGHNSNAMHLIDENNVIKILEKYIKK